MPAFRFLYEPGSGGLRRKNCKSKMLSAKKGATSSLIPRFSINGPLRGHMCMKSSPFCSGSSCKLSTQYIVQDHMAVHYKKLLSAKAVVDSSSPKSLFTSVKCKYLMSLRWIMS
ncbi:spermatogenesis-associated protein 7-like [Protopterus annectens]|uniref:spermatogenesis-associated protein 7-like n=1 Tax=Protopterus annectens TaxID=7888 RepID=UPI001CFA61F3|nr:spermatogenesis-associated protein 7-like [Protopterus annectens]